MSVLLKLFSTQCNSSFSSSFLSSSTSRLFSQTFLRSPPPIIRFQVVPKVTRPFLKTSFLVVPLGLFLRGRHGNVAICRSASKNRGNRLVSLMHGGVSKESGFDWWKLWNLISPDWIILLLAAMVTYNNVLCCYGDNVLVAMVIHCCYGNCNAYWLILIIAN